MICSGTLLLLITNMNLSFWFVLFVCSFLSDMCMFCASPVSVLYLSFVFPSVRPEREFWPEPEPDGGLL